MTITTKRLLKQFHWFVILVLWLTLTLNNSWAQTQNHRSFHMAFTYQPHDWSEDAFKKTYDFIQKNADGIFLYFDDGVPWPEALSGKPFHENVEADLNKKAEMVQKYKKTFVAVNFLGKDRASKAKYWAEEDSTALPDDWKKKPLNHPDVITAYINYCKTIINKFDPDIFIYGMEIDAIVRSTSDPDFVTLKFFISEVYNALRAEYADLDLSLSFVLLPKEEMLKKHEMIKALLPYSDIYTVSTYPFLFDGVAGNAKKIPEDLFTQIHAYIGDKPFAIAETGFNAKPWIVLSN